MAATTSGSKWPSRRCAAACRSTHRAIDRPRPARSPGGSPPHRLGAVCMPPRHYAGCLNTVRSLTKPTLWYGSSQPCDARDAAPLQDWLDQLAASGLSALASLANAIREDQPAVVQGIITPFNSGVNEGRITDLKLQRRITAGPRRRPAPTPPRRPHGPSQTPLSVTECHRPTGAQPQFTEFLPGPPPATAHPPSRPAPLCGLAQPCSRFFDEGHPSTSGPQFVRAHSSDLHQLDAPV